MSFRTIATVLALTACLSACASKAPKELPPDPGGAIAPADTGGGGSASRLIPGSQADFVASTNGQDTIYFDTDQYNIDAQDSAALQAQAQWLSRYPAKRVTLEGHADERGTREYNLALGERRANAAKNYLVGLGIDAGRISTLSYGKERPMAMGSDEDSWAKNRRAVTVTID
jgi:peptidoglycan-associated lipoprotein